MAPEVALRKAKRFLLRLSLGIEVSLRNFKVAFMKPGPFTTASLVADALSLGPHWIYNATKIARLYPNGVHVFTDPQTAFHSKRKAGEFTHYGDQAWFLYQSVRRRDGFCPKGWRDDWTAAMEDYDGYRDGATKETLASRGRTASASNDLAGAGRIGPLLDLDLPLAEMVEAARRQTSLTHGDPSVADAAEFFVRAVFAVQEGMGFRDAFARAAADGHYEALDPEVALETASSGDPEDATGTAKDIGLTCHTPEAFPLTLFFALRPGKGLLETLSENALAGGDSSARGMLLALLFAARGDRAYEELACGLAVFRASSFVAGSNSVRIEGEDGALSGVLEMPETTPRAYALFAHCFTCGKDFLPEKRITRHLANRGIATLRIDFAGLGKSGGAFKDSSFLTNLEDLVRAADWLRDHLAAPRLLVGHSLGGAAVLAAAGKIGGICAVATIGAPADPAHVTELFGSQIDEIRERGEAKVRLAGRSFVIGRRFLDDLETLDHLGELESLRDIDILILHAPKDKTVGIDNAALIFTALKHPKSFISLAEADHLLSDPKDAEYAASLIEVWARRAIQG